MTAIVKKDRAKEIEDRARECLKSHIVTCRLNQGNYRSWYCGKPGDCNMSFTITTIPGSLFMTGDMGELILQRCDDMIPWCRSAVDSIGYFAEKVPRVLRTEEWSEDLVREWIAEELADEYSQMDQEAADELEAALEEGRHAFESAIWTDHLNLVDGGDYPNFLDFTYHFYWQRAAIKWFIEKLDAGEFVTEVPK